MKPQLPFTYPCIIPCLSDVSRGDFLLCATLHNMPTSVKIHKILSNILLSAFLFKCLTQIMFSLLEQNQHCLPDKYGLYLMPSTQVFPLFNIYTSRFLVSQDFLLLYLLNFPHDHQISPCSNFLSMLLLLF